MEPIYHLTPVTFYQQQPADQPYRPATLEAEGFIHCTMGLDLLVEIANMFYAELDDGLLVLEVNPAKLAAPLKFEAPIPPANAPDEAPPVDPDIKFPHIYGPINRAAIVRTLQLTRDKANQWYLAK